MTKKIPTVRVNQSEYLDYWEKAQGFFQTMQQLFRDGNWNSTALEGIHAVILAADSVLISSKGYKCSSQRHADIVELIKSSGIEDSHRASRRLAQILDVKTLVEYSGEHYLKKETGDIVQHVERFFDWVRRILPKQPIKPPSP